MIQVKKELVQALLNYLSTRPYRESAQLIDELSKAEEIK